MNQISESECINLINQKFPGVIPYWKSYVEIWGEEAGITMKMIPFSEYAEDVIKKNDQEEIKQIF